jgi:hypothetical protein
MSNPGGANEPLAPRCGRPCETDGQFKQPTNHFRVKESVCDVISGLAHPPATEIVVPPFSERGKELIT